MKEDELTFAKAVAVAQETEDAAAARVAKETVHGPKHTEVHHIAKNKTHRADSNAQKASQKENKYRKLFFFPKGNMWEMWNQEPHWLRMSVYQCHLQPLQTEGPH